ncbi:DUF983 domain-containing protein [Solitalea sp. MAHUQ-68]|uniref:DUF983 domain-containing protein n=1 Tax=Solitalea agri TaxID=2953739 RepID=A0A9X2F1F8_9SPHI|nr:DUF983 domain-containing protein [Solitalea agri]MCO4292395.1 DUF983 domain-containing protein [Solitalea agri]
MAISKTQAIIQQKCPRCREGHVFKYSTYNLSAYQQMHTNCPVCGLRYEIEPGFFWGGMYFSYALNVMQSVILGITTYYLLDNPSAWVYLSIIIGGIFLFMPLNFRLGRVLMLHWFSFVHYDPACSKKVLAPSNH